MQFLSKNVLVYPNWPRNWLRLAFLIIFKIFAKVHKRQNKIFLSPYFREVLVHSYYYIIGKYLYGNKSFGGAVLTH